MAKPFPAGLALGNAFYDRINERRALWNNIRNTVHTVLVAPRRFGKTSLMRKVLDEHRLNYIWLDFMAITSRDEAQKRFLSHIGKLIVNIAGSEAKLKILLKKYFEHWSPEIQIGIPGLIKVRFKSEKIPHEGVCEALIKLDELAEEVNQTLVVVCDEFQEIISIDKDNTFQASIRHAAERSQSTTYLFSGSKHQPLQKIFSGKKNPLYELCDLMTLNRVSEKDYREYLQQESHNRFGYVLNEAILARIFKHTECYPKYINALCRKIWSEECEPSIELVDKLWEDYIFSRKSSITKEINILTLSQKKLFKYLSFNPTQSLYAHETSVKSNLPTSVIQSCIVVLIENDLVVKVENQYRVIDPTYKYYFKLF